MAAPEEGEKDWYSIPQEDAKETVLYLGDVTSNNDDPPVEIGASQGTAPEYESETRSDVSPFETLKGQISQEMAGQLWRAGKQSTENLINTYAHIDYLRPYFDVEPTVCLNRLVHSFLPNIKVGAPQDAPTELYGPTMLVFTLVAILLYGMKTSGHSVEDGTLIGTALFVCLGYWVGVSSIIGFFSFLFNAHLSLLQVLCLVGYSITGHCVILSFSTLFDHTGMAAMFYPTWLITTGLTSAKMTGVLLSRSWSLRDGLVLSSVAIVFNYLSILYLRFAYHRVYEAVAMAI